MKKILAAILSLGIVGGTLPAAYPFNAGQSSAEDFFDPLTKIGLPLENYPERLLGDADNDQFITPYDASKVLSVYAEASSTGKFDYSEETCEAMDADMNGKVDANDAAHILRWCIKKPAFTPGDYPRSLVEGHQNKEIAYDPTMFTSSENYVDPSAATVKPTITIDKVEVKANEVSGEDITVNISVSGADHNYASGGIHLIYDDRLTLKNLKRPDNDDSKIIFSHDTVDNGVEFFGFMCYENAGTDGILATATFTLPDDAEPGTLYPIGIKYCEDSRTFDCFGKVSNDDESKLMTSYLFTNGIENGYISVTASEEPSTVIEPTYETSIITRDGITYTIISDHAVVTACDKSLSGEVVLPDSIDGFPVIQISGSAFKNCTGITSVTIPETTETISDEAFIGCTSLSEIVFPSGVRNIGGNAFIGTPWLEAKRAEDPIVVVNGIIVDGKTCSGDVVIPDNVTFISSNAFTGCENIVSVKIPDTVRIINNAAFKDCTAMKTVEMGNNDVSLYSYVFSGCSSLENIKLPDKLSSLGLYMFKGCESLKEITVPDSVISITTGTFENCPVAKLTILNGDCMITGKDVFGDVEIHSYAGGKVENWAKTNGKTFVALSGVSTLKGDANLDKQVNIADAVLVMQVATNPDKYAQGRSELSITAQGETNADVDGKKGLTNSDALLIQKFKLGLIESFES